MSVFLIGDYFDSSLGYCNKVQNVWSPQQNIKALWETVEFNDAGWTKASSQMMSLMAFGVGMIDFCLDPNYTPNPNPSPTAPNPTLNPTPLPTTTSTLNPSPHPSTPTTKVPTPKPTVKQILLQTTLNNKKSITKPKKGIKGETTLKGSDFRKGKFKKGAKFPFKDGSGKMVRFTAAKKKKKNINFKKGSISLWYKPFYSSASDDVEHVLVVVGDYYKVPRFVLKEGDALRFSIQKSWTESWSTTALWRDSHWIVKQWVKIQVIWNTDWEDSMRIFVDGIRVNDADYVEGGWKLGSEKKAGFIYVGCANAEGTFPANGLIDEFTISKSTGFS